MTRRSAAWRAAASAVSAAVLAGCTPGGPHTAADPNGCTLPNEGPPAFVRLARGIAAHVDLLLSKYLIVIPIKSGDPVRDTKAHQGSPLSEKTPSGINKTIFEAVRLGSTKLTEGGAVASVDVVCH